MTAFEQVQLEGGPYDGMQHIASEHQGLILVGTHIYVRSTIIPCVFEYDGMDHA